MRFKFPCSCGKRLAAYSWMAGKIVECPKCRQTLTIPTPERAVQLRNGVSGETFVSTHRRRSESSREAPVRPWLWVLAILLLLAAAAFLVFTYWP